MCLCRGGGQVGDSPLACEELLFAAALQNALLASTGDGGLVAELLANTLGKPARDAVLRGEKSLVQEVALHALMKTFWP